MKLRSLGLVFGLAVAGLAAASHAAGIPVAVDLTSLIDIQSYNLGENASDQAYLLVTGTADGKTIDGRFPKGAWTVAPKKQPIDPKNPVELWKGELDNGQFAVVTVSLFQGKGEDEALNKKYIGQVNDAEQKVPELGSKTLATADDAKKLAEGLLKANAAVITKIKDLYSREKKTDHYSGQFTLLIWNNNGKLQKRLDPVGLTFGEHYGNDIKIYTKLKNTRNNVLVKNDQGEWEEQQMEPLNDDSTAVRVKGLETEYIKQDSGDPLRHTTDYLMEIKVLGGDGKPLTWTTEGENTGIDAIHTYWMFAD